MKFMKRTLIFLLMAMFGTFANAEAPFSKATRDPFVPPPTKSINGKNIADMKKAVETEWDKIQFVDKNKKPVEYLVTLQTDAGDIVIEFYPNEAPGHARSFIGLARAGFYDGLIFHRCIPDFVIQGGCPKGDGTGGPGYCVKAEFNRRKHRRGILSMARAQPADSGGSQFFICHKDVPSLDNQYTVFGNVVTGLDVVDKIVMAPTGAMDRPIKPVKINKAIVSIKKNK